MDVDIRVWQHNSPDQGAIYTRKRRPVVLVWHEYFESIAVAFAFEKRVQGWNRTKREALIRGEFDSLPELSRRAHLRPRERG